MTLFDLLQMNTTNSCNNVCPLFMPSPTTRLLVIKIDFFIKFVPRIVLFKPPVSINPFVTSDYDKTDIFHNSSKKSAILAESASFTPGPPRTREVVAPPDNVQIRTKFLWGALSFMMNVHEKTFMKRRISNLLKNPGQ